MMMMDKARVLLAPHLETSRHKNEKASTTRGHQLLGLATPPGQHECQQYYDDSPQVVGAHCALSQSPAPCCGVGWPTHAIIKK